MVNFPQILNITSYVYDMQLFFVLFLSLSGTFHASVAFCINSQDVNITAVAMLKHELRKTA